MFVFAVMVIAATRPILQAATALVQWLARAVPLGGSLGCYLVVMVLVPLMGSFITEPAAMTLAALILGNRFFRQKPVHTPQICNARCTVCQHLDWRHAHLVCSSAGADGGSTVGLGHTPLWQPPSAGRPPSRSW
jgi:hypothetical protein